MKKIILLLLTATSLMVACDDDFLEKYPETSISRENFFKTEEDLMIYTYGLYDFEGVGKYVSDIGTDNQATTGATEIKTMMTGTPSATSITGGWNWDALKDINYFLESIKETDLPEEVVNHYEGVARFFRARFYVNKVKRYSDVPWYDFVLEPDDTEALMKARDPRDVVWTKILEDYEFARQNVRADQPEGAVNKWVVLTYMARHTLYEGTYRKYHSELGLESTANDFLAIARDAAHEVINSGLYSIYSTGAGAQDYGSLFNSADLTGNAEVILTNISQDEIKNSGWWEYMFGNYEACPGKDLLQAYLNADGSYYSELVDFETKQFVDEFENRDPRLYQTFAHPGWELINTATYAQGGGIYIQQLQKNFSGYHQLKGFINNPDQTVLNNVDIPVLRYAEVLLTYAEARAELAELTQSDLDVTVNAIRDRVGMPHLTLGVTADLWQQEKYSNVASPVLLEIRRERRVELALEGFRMDDLMRWNAGHILEEEPRGLYFPGLGEYDLTGDGVEDIKLIPASESVPATKETNSLGVPFIYYRVGDVSTDASFFLSDGEKGYVVAVEDRGVFQAPKYYYRPVPANQVKLNPNLKQIFGW
ncbi:RagB/SusD family nutrient uptake outer membrane protein [Fulvivirga ulvae]|uniref:RagB/SusD family nutrient uptake outer membrane protein n=1 Tax=Fulvivirga ulvae TaxID=2904245 RepID=UPI001F16F7AF|nr:RagB/SusD family nutrient uptake outer membrane protein [Fulvivirga ulvae]UII32772.1 RagB/SusD family nutrient uptake outer membrane protein [Fulvivirga ulvae]